MNKIRIGLLTIGQSPRADGLARDVTSVLGPGFEVLECGALDGLEQAQIASLAPDDSDYRLVTLLSDGTSVEIAKRHILERLQQQINQMEAEGVVITLLMCTGAFPPFSHTKPLFMPQEALYAVVQTVAAGGRIAALTPLNSQIVQAQNKWSDMGRKDALVLAANPYSDRSLLDIEAAATQANRAGADVLFLDCFGYDLGMKQAAEAGFKAPVILARSLAARLAAEIAPTKNSAGNRGQA